MFPSAPVNAAVRIVSKIDLFSSVHVNSRDADSPRVLFSFSCSSLLLHVLYSGRSEVSVISLSLLEPSVCFEHRFNRQEASKLAWFASSTLRDMPT